MNGSGKKILLLFLAMAAVALVGWFGRKAYKSVSERKLVTQAERFLDKKDFTNAALCLQRSLQINPMSPRASQLTADALEALGSRDALTWRIRTYHLETNNIEYRFAWAQTALKLQNPQSAELALNNIEQKAVRTATYHKLKGAIAWEARKGDEAEVEYLEALRFEPSNQTISINLATVRLSSTNKAVAEDARHYLEQIPPDSTLRAAALRYLIADAQNAKDSTRALAYSKELVADPRAAFADKVNRLQLLHEAQNPEFDLWLNSLKTTAEQTSPEYVFQLSRWLLNVEGATNALGWLRSLPVSLQTNQPVPLVFADCEVEIKDWPGLLNCVDKQDWGEAESYRLALESLARRSLRQDLAAESAWRQALHACAHRLDRLSRLVQVTRVWSWKPEETEALREVTKEFPKEKWAVEQLVADLYAKGNTTELAEFLSKTSEVDPSDVRLKNCLANVFLLRKTELEKAHRLASEAYTTAPDNPFFTSTYAYSLLLQNRKEEALEVLSHVRTEDLQIPAVAAYYGVVQAQSGHYEIAKESLKRAQAGILLPEEREIVRQAMAKL
jgi:Flp pilus assembly protein TadD